MSCPLNKKIDYYHRKKSEVDDCSISNTILLTKKCLKYVSGDKEEPKTCSKINYPCVNSYYPYTEDVDVFDRIHNLLENYKPSFASFNSCDGTKHGPLFSRNDVVLNYLNSNPVSFIILGKPGVGEENLGKQLADYWHCVYIDPELLINEELQKNSKAGQCIEYNLRCGRSVGIDIILKLLERKINSPFVQHRGFVLCGLPLVPNCNYKEDPVSSVSAIFNVKEIFEEVIDDIIEIGVPTPRKVVFSSKTNTDELNDEETEKEVDNITENIEILNNIENKNEINDSIHTESVLFFENLTKPDVGLDYELQLNFIFSLLREPFLIIYITCPTNDVINKRNQYRFDIYSQRVIDVQQEYLARNVYNYIHSNPNHHEIVDELIDNGNFGGNIENLIHLVQLPYNLPANVSSQLDLYHCCVLKHIESKILCHDPQYFVKVDGRTNSSRMFSIVKARLKILPLQNVIEPTRLFKMPELIGENNEPEEDNLTLDEYFIKYSKQNLIQPYFKRILSDWGYLCPVSMTKNTFIKGDPKYAVSFLNRIFFLADEQSFIKFSNNPRMYLRPPFPRCGNNIFIFGPKYSGKTAISNCLAYYLNSEIVNIRQLATDTLDGKKNDCLKYHEEILINKALDILNGIYAEEAEKLKTEMQKEIEKWHTEIVDLLNKTVLYFENNRPSFSQFAFPVDVRKKDHTFDVILENLTEFQLPTNMECEFYENLLKNEEALFHFLPQHLKNPIETKIASETDDFVINYVNENLHLIDLEEIELKTEDFKELITNTLTENKINGRIVDDMFCDIDLLSILPSHCLPQEVIVLRDVDDYSFLLENEKYKGLRTYFNDFSNFFASINKCYTAFQAPLKTSQTDFHSLIARNIIDEIIDEQFPSDSTLKTDLYKKHITNFEENWSKVKAFFEEHKIIPIEIFVTNKSIVDLMKEIIKVLDNKYKTKATEFSEIDRAEEVQNLNQQTMQGEDFGENDGYFQDGETDLEKIRRYGETYHFCLITFMEKWVLWKGKEDYAAKFENKIYLFSSEEAYSKFLQYPRDFIPQLPCKVPPPRICVIGLGVFEKSVICKQLANNLGVHYIDFEKNITQKYALNQCFDEILKNDTLEDNELREYLINDEPLPDSVLINIVNKLWFENPIKSDGFVMKDFPKRPSDVEFMLKNITIPEMIIEIVWDENILRTKLFNVAFNKWQEEKHKKIAQIEEERINLLNDWQEKRQHRYNELMGMKQEERYKRKLSEMVEQPIDEDNIFHSMSQVSYNSVAEQEDKMEIEKILDDELPELEFEDYDNETVDEAKDRINTEIEQWYNREMEFLLEIKEKCLDENIIWSSIKCNDERTLIGTLLAVKNLQFNRSCLLERCFEVSIDIAEKLLSSGYYFLSPFGKTCPVQYYEQKNPIQMYSPAELSLKLFPVIHYEYIYYLVGRKAVEKFINDPLKYVNVPNVNFPLIPFKIAITGPPKCGKTSLACRFKEHFNLKIVSRGSAARYVLGYLPHTDLANNMELLLRQGWELTDEMVIKSVDACCYDSRATTQGVVYDGFPNTINEVRHLSYVCLVPNLVIDLQADEIQILECLINDNTIRNLPCYGKHFVKHLYKEWCTDSCNFRNWLDREYQIIGKIPIINSKWSVWNDAHILTTSVCSEIMHYYKYIKDDWPLRIANMLVTPIEFLERQSSYKNYCPCCLFYHNSLNYGGSPPDRTGLIQYRAYFYWLCNEHIEKFLKIPDLYILPYNPNKLPQNLPEVVDLKEMPDNLYQDGYCIICFNKTNQIVKGDLSLAISYNNLIYLCDKIECLNEFMKSPFPFSDNINLARLSLPSLNYNELPILGMLQQYVAKDIAKALSFVTRCRPIVPGLSIRTSAVIAIALHLQCNNEKIDVNDKKRYKMGLKLYNKKKDDLLKYLDQMKTNLNPGIYYEEPLPKFQMLDNEALKSTETSKSTLKTVFNIVDTLVNDITK